MFRLKITWMESSKDVMASLSTPSPSTARKLPQQEPASFHTSQHQFDDRTVSQAQCIPGQETLLYVAATQETQEDFACAAHHCCHKLSSLHKQAIA